MLQNSLGFCIYKDIFEQRYLEPREDPGILTIQDNHCETSPNFTFFKIFKHSGTIMQQLASNLSKVLFVRVNPD